LLLKAISELRESLDVVNLAPDAPLPAEEYAPGLRPTLVALQDALRPLIQRLLRSLSLVLNLGPDFLPDRHKHILEPGNGSKLRSLYYPPLLGE